MTDARVVRLKPETPDGMQFRWRPQGHVRLESVRVAGAKLVHIFLGTLVVYGEDCWGGQRLMEPGVWLTVQASAKDAVVEVQFVELE